MKVCNVTGCSTLFSGKGGKCAQHNRQAEKQRGTRQQRGYGKEHDQLRNQWAPRVATGTVHCHRAECGQPIRAGEAWDLGHTDDRTGYNGPEHARCNRAAGGRSARS